MIRGVLHHHSFKDDDEIQQLILPQQLHKPILKSLHDDNSHQGQQRMLNLLREKVYWPSMFRDTVHWLSQCERCLISKGNYTEPKTQQGSLTAQQSLELLCIDFTKADVAKGGKENILVLTDAFSKYSQAIVTNNQKALTIAKILVEKWFSVFGIPARIHSDQGRSFDSEIIGHLCKMYGVKQTTTTPYNPRGNSLCEWFNRTLFGLMRTLTNEQKPNWPNYLPSLVFAYNAMPHASTGLQPYKLMFGHKASMPCDNWLGLDNYKPDSFKSKTVWLNQQLNAMLHANKQALKSIKQSVQRNKNCTGGKPLDIPIGNHVLLRDHPEGQNKIQDRYKSDVYVVVGHHAEPNVYYIQLLNTDKPGSPKAVNRHQLFDLNRTSPPSEATSLNGDFAVIPSFLHPKPTTKLHNLDTTTDLPDHHYNTRSKRKAATAGRQAGVNTIITHL